MYNLIEKVRVWVVITERCCSLILHSKRRTHFSWIQHHTKTFYIHKFLLLAHSAFLWLAVFSIHLLLQSNSDVHNSIFIFISFYKPEFTLYVLSHSFQLETYVVRIFGVLSRLEANRCSEDEIRNAKCIHQVLCNKTYFWAQMLYKSLNGLERRKVE